MSRSYKKPYLKVGSPDFKKICSRAHRRISRQLLQPWKHDYLPTSERSCYGCECREWSLAEWENCQPVCDFDRLPLGPSFPLRKELVDQYTICDWKYYNPNEPRNFRK